MELSALGYSHADISGRAVEGVGLRPLACWDCGFESRRCMEFCLPGRCLCDGPITRSRVLPTVACLSVIEEPQKQGGTGSIVAAEPQKRIMCVTRKSIRNTFY